MNKSFVEYIQTQNNKHYIIVNLIDSNDYHLIQIEQIFGALIYSGVKGIDIFTNEIQIENFIKLDDNIIKKIEGEILLGYTIYGQFGYLFIGKLTEIVYELFNKHSINLIKSIKIIKIKLLNKKENINLFEKLSLFSLSNIYYYCNTFDITSPIGFLTNFNSIWNKNISISLNELPIKNLCPKIIQGSILINNIDNEDYFIIIRHLLPDSINLRGINKEGNSQIEFEIDFYNIKKFQEGFEVISQIFRIGDLPFEYSIKGKEIIINELNNFNFFDNLLENFNFNFINTISLLSDNSGIILNSLNQICNFNKNNKIGFLWKSNWISTLKNNKPLDSLFELLWSCLSQKINECNYNKFFIDNFNNINFINKQKGLFRLIILDSIEQELSAFLSLLLKSISLFKNINLQRISDLSNYSNKFLDFLMNILINISILFSNFTPFNISFRKDLNLIIPNLIQIPKISSNYLFNEELISIFLNLNPFKKICSTNSLNSYIYSPKNLNNNLLIYPFQSNLIPINKDPLIIVLANPLYLTDIIIELPSIIENGPYPTSVQIYGGLYLNRLFLIEENLLLPHSTNQNITQIRLTFDTNSNYYPNLKPFDFCPIRFLSFKFFGLFNLILLNGILVYGYLKSNNNIIKKTSKKMINEIRRRSTSTTTSDNLNNNLSSIISKEYNRINNNMLLSTFLIDLIKKNLIPDQNLFYFFTNFKNKFEKNIKKKKCENCKNNRNCINCLNCNNYYCSDCLQTNQNICNNCLIEKNVIIESIKNLTNLQYQNIITFYPFIINHFTSFLKLKSIETNSFQLLSKYPNSFLISEPPKNLIDLPCELIFNTLSNYKPDSNFINFELSLINYSLVESIEISCSNKLKLLVYGGAPNEFEFYPPTTKVDITISTRILQLTLIGDLLEIQNISIYGKIIKNIKNHFINSNFIYKTNYLTSNSSFFRKEKNQHVLNFDEKILINGLRFNDILLNCKYIIIELKITDKIKEYFYFTIPTFINQNNLNIWFNNSFYIISIKIWYIFLNDYNIINSTIPIPLQIIEKKN